MGTEEHVVGVVHVGVGAPQALLHHDLHVPFGLRLADLCGLGQAVDVDGFLFTAGGQIFGKAPGPALDPPTAQQHADTAGQEARAEREADKVHDAACRDDVPQLACQANGAEGSQDPAEDVQEPGLLFAVFKGLFPAGGRSAPLHRGCGLLGSCLLRCSLLLLFLLLLLLLLLPELLLLLLPLLLPLLLLPLLGGGLPGLRSGFPAA